MRSLAADASLNEGGPSRQPALTAKHDVTAVSASQPQDVLDFLNSL